MIEILNEENKEEKIMENTVTITMEEYRNLLYKANGLVMIETAILDNTKLDWYNKWLTVDSAGIVAVMTVLRAIDRESYNQVLAMKHAEARAQEEEEKADESN